MSEGIDAGEAGERVGPSTPHFTVLAKCPVDYRFANTACKPLFAIVSGDSLTETEPNFDFTQVHDAVIVPVVAHFYREC